MPDPLDPVEALEPWEVLGHSMSLDPDGMAVLRDALDETRLIVAALPAPEPTLTGEETVNWYGLLRSAAAILPEVETPERLLVAARNVAADIDAALAPYPTSFDLPAAAPVPEGVPEDPGPFERREQQFLEDAANFSLSHEAVITRHLERIEAAIGIVPLSPTPPVAEGEQP